MSCDSCVKRPSEFQQLNLHIKGIIKLIDNDGQINVTVFICLSLGKGTKYISFFNIDIVCVRKLKYFLAISKVFLSAS